MSGPGVSQPAKKEEANKSNATSQATQPTPARKPTELKTITEFREFITAHAGRLTIILIIQDWAENCASTYNVVVELANEPEFETVAFAEVVAEEHPDICAMLKIVGVPSVLFYKNGAEVERVVGVRVREVAKKMKFHVKQFINVPQRPLQVASPPPQAGDSERTKAQLNERLKSLIESSKVMVFMKGTRDVPKCGFSRTLMEILRETGVEFGTFDILNDEAVRQGLKEYSNWQTYPQLYVDGQLIGGLDIVKELKITDELVSTLKGEQ